MSGTFLKLNRLHQVLAALCLAGALLAAPGGSARAADGPAEPRWGVHITDSTLVPLRLESQPRRYKGLAIYRAAAPAAGPDQPVRLYYFWRDRLFLRQEIARKAPDWNRGLEAARQDYGRQGFKVYEDSAKRILRSNTFREVTFLLYEWKGEGAYTAIQAWNYRDTFPQAIRYAIEVAHLERGRPVPSYTSAITGEIKIFSDEDRARMRWPEKERFLREEVLTRMFPRLTLGEVGPEHVGPMPEVRLSDDLDWIEAGYELLTDGASPAEWGRAHTGGVFSTGPYRIRSHWLLSQGTARWNALLNILWHEGSHACFTFLQRDFVKQLAQAVPHDDAYREIELSYGGGDDFGETSARYGESVWREILLDERIAYGVAGSPPLDFTAGRGEHARVWNEDLPRVLAYLTGEFPTQELGQDTAALKAQLERLEREERDYRLQEAKRAAAERRAREEEQDRELAELRPGFPFAAGNAPDLVELVRVTATDPPRVHPEGPRVALRVGRPDPRFAAAGIGVGDLIVGYAFRSDPRFGDLTRPLGASEFEVLRTWCRAMAERKQAEVVVLRAGTPGGAVHITTLRAE